MKLPATEELPDGFAEAFDALTIREKFVLEKRFALNGGEPMTLRAIANWMKITPERVRQIEYKSIRKLRGGVGIQIGLGSLLNPASEPERDPET